MPAAPSPAPSPTASAASGKPMAGRCSLMKSATWISPCRPSCCACCRTARRRPVGGRAVPVDVRILPSTLAICAPWSRVARFPRRIFFIGSASRPFTSPEGASGCRIFSAARRAIPRPRRRRAPAFGPSRPQGCWLIPGPAMCASCATPWQRRPRAGFAAGAVRRRLRPARRRSVIGVVLAPSTEGLVVVLPALGRRAWSRT